MNDNFNRKVMNTIALEKLELNFAIEDIPIYCQQNGLKYIW
jgi:hypothetical protein